jgi:hypothetical protein
MVRRPTDAFAKPPGAGTSNGPARALISLGAEPIAGAIHLRALPLPRRSRGRRLWAGAVWAESSARTTPSEPWSRSTRREVPQTAGSRRCSRPRWWRRSERQGSTERPLFDAASQTRSPGYHGPFGPRSTFGGLAPPGDLPLRRRRASTPAGRGRGAQRAEQARADTGLPLCCPSTTWLAGAR